jgi:FkbM family methyltransferase
MKRFESFLFRRARDFVLRRGFVIRRGWALGPRGTDRAVYERAQIDFPSDPAILDIGAHQGQTTAAFLASFPEARIHAFEPFPESYAVLDQTFEHDDRVTCHQIAISDRRGTTVLHLGKTSQEHSLRPLNAPRSADATVEVSTIPLDDFLEDRGIDRIDILKSDTEGMELEVLKGATRLLGSDRLRSILIEVGFSEDDPQHVPLHTVTERLAGFGFGLHGLFDHYYDKDVHVFSNALFVKR